VGGAKTIVRVISSCNLKVKSPPFYARAWRDAEKLRAPLPAKHQFPSDLLVASGRQQVNLQTDETGRFR